MHTEALPEQVPQMPDGISLQPGAVQPGSGLMQLSCRDQDPSQAGTGAQPEQDPACGVPAEQAAASVGGTKSPGRSMPDAEQGAPAAAPVAEEAGTGGPAGRPEGAAAAGNTGPLKPLQTDNNAAAEQELPLPRPKVAAADAEPGCRASGTADGSAGDALPGLSAPPAVPHAAPPAPDMEPEGATTTEYARTLEPEAGTGTALANTQQGRAGRQAAPPGPAQAEADPKALAGPSPMQGLLRSKGMPAANQLAGCGHTVLSKPSSVTSLHFSHPRQPQKQQAGLPLPSGQAATVLAGHGLSRGPAAARGRSSPVAVSLPPHRPSAFGAPGSLGGSLRPLPPSMSQATNGPLLGGGPQQTRMPMSTAPGGHCLSTCATLPDQSSRLVSVNTATRLGISAFFLQASGWPPAGEPG